MKTFGSLSLTKRSDLQLESGRSMEDRRLVEEKAFYDLVANATRQGVKDTLGPDVVGILESKGFLDNIDEPVEFDRQLTSVFGNGAKVLERLVVKELYRELGISYNTQTPFSYQEFLASARTVCLMGRRIK